MAGRTERQGDLLQGTLDMLVLQILRWRPAHGYSISQAIRAASNNLFRVETGSLYPALHRLEKRGLLRAEWKTSDNKQRARYYRLTPAGRRHLTREHSRWNRLVDAVHALMHAPEREAET
jgi:PadR family transcriptional regulator, regulatory protein PadR